MADGFTALAARPDTPPRVRTRWTADEFLRLSDSGGLGDATDVELVDGALIEIPPEGSGHLLNVSRTLQRLAALIEARPELAVGFNGAVRLGPDRVVGPDVLVFRRPVGRPSALEAGSVLLAVEHAYSTRRYDLEQKPSLYAEAGVPELWVLDNVDNVLHRFHSPARGAYFRDQPLALEDLVRAPFAPERPVKVGELFDLG